MRMRKRIVKEEEIDWEGRKEEEIRRIEKIGKGGGRGR